MNLKRIMPLTIAVSLALIVTAYMNEDTDIFEQGVLPNVSNSIQIANPFSEYATLEEAEEAVEFDFMIPNKIGQAEAKQFRTVNSIMIEVCYLDKETETVRVRKALGSDDVSGDYTEYSTVKEVNAGKRIIAIKGNENVFKSAIWNEDGHTYSIACDPMEQEALLSIIEQIR